MAPALLAIKEVEMFLAANGVWIWTTLAIIVWIALTFWPAHHGIFRRLAYANQRLMLLNLLLLVAVSFLPFPTKLMAEAIHNEDAARTAVIFYGGTLLVISLLLSALWGSVTLDRHVLKPEVSDNEVKAIALVTTPSIGFYAAMIALAFFAPRVAIFGYLVISIIALLRMRGDSMPARTTTLA